MKKIGFLSFNYWSDQRGSRVRSAGESLRQSVDLAVAAEEIGIDGAYFRVHHFAEQQANPFPLLASIAARTTALEVGTGVIDMRYENPLSLAEQAAATDLLSSERLQLGVSRGSPEHADRGYRYFGHEPERGSSDADMARERTVDLLSALKGGPIAAPNPQLYPGGRKLPITPRSDTLRERVWWGAGNLHSALWAAKQGMQLMSSTLIQDEKGIPFDRLQLEQIDGFRKAWHGTGWEWAPQVSVARGIMPIVDDATRAYFAGKRSGGEGVGQLEGISSRFGPSFYGEPKELVERLRHDAALDAADMVMITIPNQLGVEFNTTLLEGIKAVGDALGWNHP